MLALEIIGAVIVILLMLFAAASLFVMAAFSTTGRVGPFLFAFVLFVGAIAIAVAVFSGIDVEVSRG